MLRWILDLSRVRRARKAACEVPWSRSAHRLGAIPDAAWSPPCGFMVMLITIAAKTESGKIDGQPLCLVQAGAWTSPELNAARNHDFEIGRQNAMTPGPMLIGSSILASGRSTEWQERNLDVRDNDATVIGSDRGDVSALWERFFDVHVSVHIRDIGMEPEKSPLQFS